MKKTPLEVLSMSKEVPDPDPYYPLYEYGETIHILYKIKKMTYNEISVWLEKRGLKYTGSHVANAYKEWKYRHPSVEELFDDDT